jgi:hypothetical protein
MRNVIGNTRESHRSRDGKSPERRSARSDDLAMRHVKRYATRKRSEPNTNCRCNNSILKRRGDVSERSFAKRDGADGNPSLSTFGFSVQCVSRNPDGLNNVGCAIPTVGDCVNTDPTYVGPGPQMLVHTLMRDPRRDVSPAPSPFPAPFETSLQMTNSLWGATNAGSQRTFSAHVLMAWTSRLTKSTSSLIERPLNAKVRAPWMTGERTCFASARAAFRLDSLKTVSTPLHLDISIFPR